MTTLRRHLVLAALFAATASKADTAGSERTMFENWNADQVDANGVPIFVRWAGAGPPVLLLHGFPETHLMWREIAPVLARTHTVVCADLRGYGQSGKPEGDVAHEAYSKRTMALDMLELMGALGHPNFAVVGHDRGGRVAYRLALDHPSSVQRLTVLDIIPTSEALDRADARFAQAYWPWSLLAQPAPFPEALIAADPEAIITNAFETWGAAPVNLPAAVRAAYVSALRDPASVHAICEEYRAALSIDLAHERIDHERGVRIQCPVLALWGKGGPLDTWYDDAGGPLSIWRNWATNVSGAPIEGGHFFPEANASAMIDALAGFLTARP